MTFTRTKIEEYSDSIAGYCNNELSRQGKNLKVVADTLTAEKLVDIQQNEYARITRIDLMKCILGRDNYGFFDYSIYSI